MRCRVFEQQKPGRGVAAILGEQSLRCLAPAQTVTKGSDSWGVDRQARGHFMSNMRVLHKWDLPLMKRWM